MERKEHMDHDTTPRPDSSTNVRVNSRGYVRPRIYNMAKAADGPPAKMTKLLSGSTTEVIESSTEEFGTILDLQGKLLTVENSYTTNINTGDLVVPLESNSTAGNKEVISERETEDDTVDTPLDLPTHEYTSSDFPANDDTGNHPIYPGHTMTAFTGMLLIWVYAMTHSITGSQLSDLLTLINVHCLTEVPMYSSLQQFKKIFADLKSPLVKHFYCSHCLMQVEKHTQMCSNHLCQKDFSKDQNKSYFIEFPIGRQIAELFQRKTFRENLKYRFKRIKKRAQGIEDIYDGLLYRRLAGHDQPLSEQNNISLTWNTDGVPVFKSSKVSIWPMYLMINELPYKERIKKSNMLFYGLWFGENKPSINLFCNPMLDSLMELETVGLNVSVDNETVNVKAFLICGTADLPARSTALNMIQFNGDYSCARCMQKGRTEKTGTRGHTHVFPYDKENPTGPNRTSAECLQHSLTATQTTKPVYGMKGPSMLMSLNSYNFISSTSIDYMHCILLGITKKLMTLWFTVTHSCEPYSLVNKLSVVDERLVSIRPTYHITRRPRSVSEHFKYWKASEFRAWLFFYSVPILVDLLPPVYLFHYCALVEGIWILCKDSILQDELEYSNTLLKYFVFMLEPLYGARYCTLNAHSLLHLSQCVQDLGPLWVYSCFPFESLNGELLKLFHGTQSIETQIMGAVNIHQILPSLIDKLPTDCREIPFIKRYVSTGKIALGLRVDHDTYVIGGTKKIKLTNLQQASFTAALGYLPSYITFYGRIMVRSLLLHSISYTRVKARNSYTVKYIGTDKEIHFGSVQFFAVSRDCNCSCEVACICLNNVLACIKVFQKVSESVLDVDRDDYPKYLRLRVAHIHKMQYCGKLEVVEIHKILSLCVDVVLNENFHFICEYPNLSESD